MANVVSVTDVGEFESAKCAESFFKSEEIGERLAGMKLIGKCVDDRNIRILRKIIERFLDEYARNDSVEARAVSNPAFSSLNF